MEEERTIDELERLLPTHIVVEAYLISLKVGTWGKTFYIPGNINGAIEAATQIVDAVNAIRNLALDHEVDVHEAARRYRQLKEGYPI